MSTENQKIVMQQDEAEDSEEAEEKEIDLCEVRAWISYQYFKVSGSFKHLPKVLLGP